MKITQRIQELIDANFKPTVFFEYVIISDLAVYLAEHYATILEHLHAVKKERSMQIPDITQSESVTTSPDKIVPSVLPQTFSLSEGQKGLWLLQTMTPSMSAYNVPIALRFHERLEVNALQQAMLWLVTQHSILQAQFNKDEHGQIYQTIQQQRSINLVTHDLDACNNNELITVLEKHVKRPFNLQQDVLIRFDLWISPTRQESVLLIVVHHIVFDGTSTLILLRDLLQAYRAYSNLQAPQAIPKLSFYADFVAWEEKMLTVRVHTILQNIGNNN